MCSHIFLFGSLLRRRPPEFTAILMFEFWREATATSVPGLLCQSGRRRPENVSILSSLLLGNCGHQTDRKIYDQGQIALCLRFSRVPRASRATKLEIHFRKNLAKLTGSAVRIDSKKPKGKKTMKEKKNGSSHAGMWTYTPSSSSGKSDASDHSAMRPLHQLCCKINSIEVSFSAIYTVRTLWSCIYHKFKDTFDEK